MHDWHPLDMTTTERATPSTDSPGTAALTPHPKRTVWTVLTGVFGAVSGVAPHVLHHVAPLLGAALLAGAAGTALFGAIGLLASVPFLLRLHRRFRSWWAPSIAVAFFATTFLVSSLWLGPLINRALPWTPNPTSPTTTEVDHAAHHQK